MLRKKPYLKFTYDIFECDFSSDMSLFVTIGNPIKLWDLKSKKKIKTIKTITHSCNISFSKNNDLLMVKNTSGEIAIHDINDESKIIKTGIGYEGSNFLITQNGLSIIDSSWDGHFIIWKTKTGEAEFYKKFPFMIRQNLYSKYLDKYYFNITGLEAKSNFLTLDSSLNTFKEVNFDSLYEIWKSDINLKGDLIAIMALNKNSSQRVFCLSIFDLEKNKLLEFIELKDFSYGNVEWHPSGKLIVVSEKLKVSFIKYPNLEVISVLEVNLYAQHIKISPDGKFIVIGRTYKSNMLIEIESINGINNYELKDFI